MKITIFGGGNIGTQFAVHCAEKGHQTTMYCSKPDVFQKTIYVLDAQDRILHTGTLRQATHDAAAAFSDADLIFVTVPAFCMQAAAETVYPFVKPGAMICIVPGSGGGECSFAKCLQKGAVVFGMQRVPSVARLKAYGEAVYGLGYRDALFVASLPADRAAYCAGVIGSIFDMPCSAMPNYLNLTLTPSNPILHTTRLRTIFKDYHAGVVYKTVPLFYEDWNDESSERLFLCDAEVQSICRALEAFDLSYVKSLTKHYESPTPSALTRKISGIQSFKGLKTPTVAAEGGLIPDFNSRYFTADFPFGLAILIQIADMIGTNAENMKETMRWYNDVGLPHDSFRYADYGITTYEAFAAFYGQ
ncbi:MAG: NAD/NADP octopine/nopaline dehydrogenase family protein [Clostridia bacterium]|nr:NAD/NADP octopine/nopaline dehydrogenase family protein [Clostridia bacterium]